MAKKRYLGIIAQIKAGKDTVARMIQDVVAPRTVQIINYSDALKDILLALALPEDRHHFQRISHSVRTEFGADVLARAIQARAERSTADLVILVGIRRIDDLELLNALPDTYLLYLTAPQELRWKWLREKGERPGDSDKTLEQFQIEDNNEAEQSIQDVGAAKAHGRIENNGSIDDLHHQIQLLLQDNFLTDFQKIDSRSLKY